MFGKTHGPRPRLGADIIVQIEKAFQIKFLRWSYLNSYRGEAVLADNSVVKLAREDDRSQPWGRHYEQHYSFAPKTPWKAQRRGPGGVLLGEEIEL
jgi:hypothetical protein